METRQTEKEPGPEPEPEPELDGRTSARYQLASQPATASSKNEKKWMMEDGKKGIPGKDDNLYSTSILPRAPVLLLYQIPHIPSLPLPVSGHPTTNNVRQTEPKPKYNDS
jgi:hypothetical protein